MSISSAQHNARKGSIGASFNLAFRSQWGIYEKGLALADSPNPVSASAISRLISKGSFDAANNIAFKLLSNAKTAGQKSAVCADYVSALVNAKNPEPATKLAQSLFAELNLDAVEILGREMGKTSYAKHGFAVAQPFTRDGQIIGMMALKAKRGIATGQPQAASADESLFKGAPSEVFENEGQLLVFLAKKILEFQNGDTSSMSAQEIAFVKNCLAKGIKTERLAALGFTNKEIAEKTGMSGEEVGMALEFAFGANPAYGHIHSAAIVMRTLARFGLNDEEAAAVAEAEQNISPLISDAILKFIHKNDDSFAREREDGAHARQKFAELTAQGFSLDAKTRILGMSQGDAAAIEEFVLAFDVDADAALLAAEKMSQIRQLALAGFSAEEAGMLSCSIVWENEAEGKTVKKVRKLVVQKASVKGAIERLADQDKEIVFREMVELGISQHDAAKTVMDAKLFYMKPFPDAAVLASAVEDAKKIIRSLTDYDDGHIFSSAPGAAAFKGQLALHSLPAPSDKEIGKILELEDGECLSLNLGDIACLARMKDGTLNLFGSPFVKAYDFAQKQLEAQKMHADIEECIRTHGLKTPGQIIRKLGRKPEMAPHVRAIIGAMKIEEIKMRLFADKKQGFTQDSLASYSNELFDRLSNFGVATFRKTEDREGNLIFVRRNPNEPFEHPLPYSSPEEIQGLVVKILEREAKANSGQN